MSHQLASSSLIFLSSKPANQKIIAMLFILSYPSTCSLVSLSKTLSFQTLNLACSHSPLLSPVSINMNVPAFACKSIMSKTQMPFSPNSAFKSLKTFLLGHTHEPPSPNFKVLPFRKGRPLAGSTGYQPLNWQLGWLSLSDCKLFLKNSEVNLSEESMVYVSAELEDNVVYWAIDVSEANNLEYKLGSGQFCFIELRTLMVATDWSDPRAIGELAVAGHARALLEWHNISQFCGHCGERTVTMEAGRRKQCSNELCKKGIYPRVDPVVIMLVIDKENDRALLSRKSRYVPRMWSCLAGFIEPGESLEEAVRRETWEETGIEVGEVVYDSSQPWPVGPSSMPCQLMVGFFAYAKSLEIKVDKEELEDAKWHDREDVKKALTFTEYKKAQRNAAAKVDQMCKGVEEVHNLSANYNMESGEFAPMFIPGPSTIAHRLISSWVYRDE